jgi:hypothetical protein
MYIEVTKAEATGASKSLKRTKRKATEKGVSMAERVTHPLPKGSDEDMQVAKPIAEEKKRSKGRKKKDKDVNGHDDVEETDSIGVTAVNGAADGKKSKKPKRSKREKGSTA